MAKRETPKPAAIRDARQFLKKKKLLDVFSPKAFAAAAQETGQGLADTLRYLAHLQAGGQGEGPFAETAETLREAGAAAA